jgi:hypothetical protein
MLASLRIMNLCHKLYDCKRFAIVFCPGKCKYELNLEDKMFNMISDTVGKAEMFP